jgi:hypothetical protein
MGKAYDVGKGTKFITKLLKNSTVNISYTTSNTIGNYFQSSLPPNKIISMAAAYTNSHVPIAE